MKTKLNIQDFVSHGTKISSNTSKLKKFYNLKVSELCLQSSHC